MALPEKPEDGENRGAEGEFNFAEAKGGQEKSRQELGPAPEHSDEKQVQKCGRNHVTGRLQQLVTGSGDDQKTKKPQGKMTRYCCSQQKETAGQTTQHGKRFEVPIEGFWCGWDDEFIDSRQKAGSDASGMHQIGILKNKMTVLMTDLKIDRAYKMLAHVGFRHNPTSFENDECRDEKRRKKNGIIQDSLPTGHG
jgi:hypothetical protein